MSGIPLAGGSIFPLMDCMAFSSVGSSLSWWLFDRCKFYPLLYYLQGVIGDFLVRTPRVTSCRTDGLAWSFRGPLTPKQEQVILGLGISWTITPGLGVTGEDRTCHPLGVLCIVFITIWPFTYFAPRQTRQRLTFHRRTRHHLEPLRNLLKCHTMPLGSVTVLLRRFGMVAP